MKAEPIEYNQGHNLSNGQAVYTPEGHILAHGGYTARLELEPAYVALLREHDPNESFDQRRINGAAPFHLTVGQTIIDLETEVLTLTPNRIDFHPLHGAIHVEVSKKDVN